VEAGGAGPLELELPLPQLMALVDEGGAAE